MPFIISLSFSMISSSSSMAGTLLSSVLTSLPLMSVFKLKPGPWSDLSSTSKSPFDFFFLDLDFDSFLVFFFSDLSFLSFFNFLDLVFFGFLRLVSSVAMLTVASLHLLGGGEGDLLVDREGPREDGDMSLV